MPHVASSGCWLAIVRKLVRLTLAERFQGLKESAFNA